MRWIGWVSVLLVACCLASPAALGAAICGNCGGCSTSGCVGPSFGMQPGCGECQSHGCDNAWAGYCQEKARCQAFWYRLGTGGSSWFDWASIGCEPTCVNCEPAEQSLPPESAEQSLPLESAKPAESEEAPLPPLPEPAAEKTSSK